jgi:hypothetical protein
LVAVAVAVGLMVETIMLRAVVVLEGIGQHQITLQAGQVITP